MIPPALATGLLTCFNVLLHYRPPQHSASHSSLETILCYHCDGNTVGVRGKRGDMKIEGRRKMCRERGIEPRFQELARPPHLDTTGPRLRAFEVVLGSCYTNSLSTGEAPALDEVALVWLTFWDG